MASHDHCEIFSSQIKHVPANLARQIFYTLSMKILWNLQKKMNLWTIFSPYHKHCTPFYNMHKRHITSLGPCVNKDTNENIRKIGGNHSEILSTQCCTNIELMCKAWHYTNTVKVGFE